MAEKAGLHAKTQESKQRFSSSCKRKPKFNSSGSSADRILQLQRTAGNQAVQRLIKSRALQAKLKIGQPNDIYEQEADRVAEQVMRMSDPVLQKCSKCGPDKRKFLQTKGSSEQALFTGGQNVPPIVRDVLGSSGQPLDPITRTFMEQRFGYDFSQVRVHAGTTAEQSARDVNAHAYTVGYNIVFGEAQFAPETHRGRRLIAHELAHVVQQSSTHMVRAGHKSERYILFPISHILQPVADTHIARKTDEEEEESKKKTAENEAPKAETPLTSTDIPQVGTGPGVDVTATTSTPTQPAAIWATVTSGGHTPAPAGIASCPDAPARNIVIVGCTAKPSSPPLATEKAVLPPLNPGRFGNDADRAKFAKHLAQCRAEREAKKEIEKRFLSDVKAAKKSAAEEARVDTEEAIKAATEGLDPKDKKAISRAKAQAIANAKKAAAKKMEAAQAAVLRQNVATVTAELASKFEDELATDYDNTIKSALVRFRTVWLSTMQKRLERERKRISKEKKAKPKVVEATPPPAKSTNEIAAEIEEEMVQVRCDQQEWARNQIEAISQAWAVGRREEVDFRTLPQKAAYLKDFKPAYEAVTTSEIPSSLQTDTRARQGVAPELADFLSQLAVNPDIPSFTASNRPGHGGGTWAGKGFSTDLFIKAPLDSRGFWQHSTAVRFLLALDATAKALGARWRVLYNDFGVAQEVNQITGSLNVVFIGTSSIDKLNWHGPSPLVLHFHLDLEIPQKKPTTGNQP
jgi:hypothetical protein